MFYSEYGEDRWIAEQGLLPVTGFYVDLGAMRPDQNSNTAFLRDRGWNGLAIDGHPDCTQWWKDVPANFRVQVLARKQEDVIFEFGSPGHEAESRILPSTEKIVNNCGSRLAKTLDQVLSEEEVVKIDFLSIDIEGSEFDVLQGLNFGRHRPSVIIAEYNTLGIGKDYRVLELLLASDYIAVHQTVANLVYVRR